MISELHTASELLSHAIDRYLAACLAISSQCKPWPGSVLHDSLKSHTVAAELQAIDSFETRIVRTKRALGKLQNSFRDVAPINALPPEILSRVFRLASGPSECLLHDPLADNPLRYPSRAPEILPEVCSYWRSVALEARTLWTHIDLSPRYRLTRRFIERAKLFAARAGHLLLTIHIHIPVDKPPASPRDVDALLEFCALVASRAASIQVFHEPEATLNAMIIVRLLLANSVPGKLAQLTLLDTCHGGRQGFIAARNTGQLFNPRLHWEVDLAHDELEELLLGVTDIHLNRNYPHWTSRAYHGLVKLDLTDSSGTCISITELAGILKASPQLRFFHFGVGIMEDAIPEPVRMDNLEVLSLEFEHEPHGCILDLILPGSKPLRMSIVAKLPEAPDLTQGGFRRFFERSNVTGLHVDYSGDWIQFDIFRLFELVPNAQLLSLDGAQIFDNYEAPSNSEGVLKSHLQLYVSTCCIFPEVFRLVTQRLPNAKIVINSEECLVGNEGDPDVGISKEQMDMLTAIRPDVTFVDGITFFKSIGVAGWM